MANATLRKVRLNSGGYAPGKHGQYFGHMQGTDVYAWTVDTGETERDGYVRAATREAAKDAVREALRWYPDVVVRFHR